MAGFVDAIAQGDAGLANRYLDLSGLPARQRDQAAERLQALLDRAGRFAPRSQISAESGGEVLDGLDPDRERVGTVTVDGELHPILLERRGSGEETRWLISSETLALAAAADGPAAFASPIERWAPDELNSLELGGAPASHWLALLLVTAAAFLACWALLKAALAALCRITRHVHAARDLLRAIVTPLALLGAVLVGSLSGPALGASLVARQAMAWWFEMGAILACGWIGFRILGAASDRLIGRLSQKGRLNAGSIVQFAARLVKLVILFATVMAVLNAAGFDVSAALAALGIGGLALALGAQKTVENLIASLTILSDRPFRIGEICRFGERTGKVEDIGMRSSRIRTLDGTLLTIPNSNLSNSEIENFSRRSKGWLHPMLHLPITTPPDRVERLLASLRDALAGDPRLHGEEARVRLLPPSADRLPIEVFGYIRTTDYDTYLEVQEELLIKLLQVVVDHGLTLAPPALQLSADAASRSGLQLLKAS